MALFVFISGYFYKEKHEDHILKYIWSRVKRLLIPAFLWNIAYGLFILVMSNFGYTIGAEVTPYNLFVMPFVDGEAFSYNLGSWFVYPLFCVYIINILFRKLLNLIGAYNEYLILFVYTIIGISGVQISILNVDEGISGVMLLALRTAFFLPCFEFGKFYKAKLEKHDNLNNIAYFAIIFAVQLILLTACDSLVYKPSKTIDFNNGCVIPYISAITGIAFWLRVSKLLTPAVNDWKVIRLISDNTYSIMIHQMLGFMVVKWIMYALNLTTSLFPDFDPVKLKSSIWYYYLPNGLQQYALVYLIAGIFVPVAIGVIQKKCAVYLSGRLAPLKNKKALKFSS